MGRDGQFHRSRDNDPERRLDLLLQTPGSSAREGRAKFDTKTTLGLLCVSVLRGAFVDHGPEDNPKVPWCLLTLLAANLPPPDVYYPVRSFPKSFPDFITDPSRYINQRLRVSPPIIAGNFWLAPLSQWTERWRRTCVKSRVSSSIPRWTTCGRGSSDTNIASRGASTSLMGEPEIISVPHRFPKKFSSWRGA